MTEHLRHNDLGAQAATGDNEAFLQLYDHFVTPIYRFVYFRVPSKEQAEDIVGEVFLKAWKYRARFARQTGGSYQSWLYTIARRQLIDTVRKTKETVPLDDIFGLGEHAFHADPHEQQRIAAALEALTPMQQDVLRLRFWHELSFDEIAAVLGKSSASCRMHASRAVQSLREVLPADVVALTILIPTIL